MGVYVFKDTDAITLGDSNATPLGASTETQSAVTVINSITNDDSVIYVGGSTPSVALKAGDSYTFHGVSLSRLFAKGADGDRVEFVINTWSRGQF